MEAKPLVDYFLREMNEGRLASCMVFAARTLYFTDRSSCVWSKS